MKWLKHLRLINWHYFRDETLEFGRQTLLTGRNTAGKSTVIDALQVLFIANQKQIRFNSAAHEEAKRSYLSYLRGKIGGKEKKFIREKDFNTYITADFYDQDKKEYFTTGVVVDVAQDDNLDEEYFILAGYQLSDLNFKNQHGKWKSRDEFHRYCTSLDGKHIFERNKSNYQKALLNRMGQVHERFFSTFVKALSFKPINDVRDFVYKFILDEKELQLDLMKKNFDIHEQYRKELDALQERKNSLDAISRQFQTYSQLCDIIDVQEYIILGLKHQCESELVGQLTNEINSLNAELRQLEQDLLLVKQQLEEAKEKSQNSYRKWQNHELKKREQELQESICQKQNDISTKQRQYQAIEELIQNELRLINDLIPMEEDDYWQREPGVQEKLTEAVHLINLILAQHVLSNQIDEGTLEQFKGIGIIIAKQYESFTRASIRVSDHLKDLAEKKVVLEGQIRDLENKKRPYRQEMLVLKKILAERLAGRSPVWIFCEEVDLIDETWRDAMEGYLHTQRFDLLVKPDCFKEALSIYEKEKYHHHIEGIGLVDTIKESKYLGSAENGSLAQELKTANAIIQARIDHLLGKVMKAKDEQDLLNFSASVTRSCMSYHNLVARQIQKERYAIPYIGAQAIIRQLEIKRQELLTVETQLNLLKIKHGLFTKWVNNLSEKKSRYENLSENLNLPFQIKTLEQEKAQSEQELSLLDMSEVEKLKHEYDLWASTVNQKIEVTNRLSGSIATQTTILNDKNTKLWLAEKDVNESEASWAAWKNQISPLLLPKADERWREVEMQHLPTKNKLVNWENNQKGNITRRDGQEYVSLCKLRQAYNTRYTFNAEVEAKDNAAYDKILNEISTINIPEYQTKLAEALHQSEEEFKAHFIFKLREAIESAKRDFEQLNYALNHLPFNEDKYHFEVRPDDKYKRFYEIIMDSQMYERGSVFELQEEEKTAVLHELFEKLVHGEAGDMDEFTDYRSYLDYDIVVTSGSHRYHFSDVLREKSGGETQTPFYIAILASFNHLYSSQKTMRLVAFDEAFNKMDEERIQTSLRLIKQLNLQLIAAVPDEKMPYMAPEVDTTLIVHRDGFNCFVDLIAKDELKELIGAG